MLSVCSSLAMDTALEAMTVSYSPSHQNSLHTQEQYRLQTIYDDVNVERDGKSVRFTDWKTSLSITLPPQCLSVKCFWRTRFCMCSRIRKTYSWQQQFAQRNGITDCRDRHSSDDHPTSASTDRARTDELITGCSPALSKIHFLLASMFGRWPPLENAHICRRLSCPTISGENLLQRCTPHAPATPDIDHQANQR